MAPEAPKYIDLFAGCGGLSLGLKKSGWRGLFAVEKDSFAFETLKHNLIIQNGHFDWPEWLPKKAHDIDSFLKVYKSEVRALAGKVKMVAGGPPCQGFSVNGKRQQADKRNLLVDSYIDFIELVQPQVILFENVKGFTMEFIKNGTGTIFSDQVAERLRGLGYNIDADLVNFAEFGIPQRRLRFILFGTKKGSASDFFALLKSNKDQFLAKRGITAPQTVAQAISDLKRTHGATQCPDSESFESGIYGPKRTAYQKLMRANSNQCCPDSHRFARHTQTIIDRFSEILTRAPKNKQLSDCLRKEFNLKKRSITPLSPDYTSPTITSLPDDYIHYSEPRILTVRECARIQSFPDNFLFKGKYTSGGNRRTKEVPRYTQVGNAVPPLFAELAGEIIKQLL